mgnify:CR=1 FL=1
MKFGVINAIMKQKIESLRGGKMSILKNEIPILEFDTEKNAVINPTHENLDIKLPSKCVLLFWRVILKNMLPKNNLKTGSPFH